MKNFPQRTALPAPEKLIRNEQAEVCRRCCIPKEKRHLESETHISWGDLIDFENIAADFVASWSENGAGSWILLIQCLENVHTNILHFHILYIPVDLILEEKGEANSKNLLQEK